MLRMPSKVQELYRRQEIPANILYSKQLTPYLASPDSRSIYHELSCPELSLVVLQAYKPRYLGKLRQED